MADRLAISAVSRTLRSLLEERMRIPDPPDPKTPVTIAPPGITVAGIDGTRANLFLYRVSENGFLKNQEIPGQGYRGAYGHPPLSLDLHYLITVYDPEQSDQVEQDADLESQEILGDLMRVLHDYPIIDDTLMKVSAPGDTILDAALLNEYEKVKLYLEPIGLEDFTNVWTALSANYRLSVAYQISVVQIESQAERTLSLPVQVRNVYVQTFRTPQIREVYREPPLLNIRSPAVAVGETLRIVGSNLAGDATSVALGDVLIPIPSPGDEQIDLVVPDTLPAGVHAVQVIHDVNFGTPADPHRGFRSNAVACVLIPTITGFDPASPPGAGAGSTLTVSITPSLRAGQEVTLLLEDRSVSAEPFTPGSDVDFVLPAVPTDDYLVRVRVDGAESRLDYDTITNTFMAPLYTVI